MIGSEASRAPYGAPGGRAVQRFGGVGVMSPAREVHSFAPAADSRQIGETDAWFEHDECARFILDLRGAVLRANASARALAASGIVGSGGVFICSRHRSRGELDQLLERLAGGLQDRGRIHFRAGDDAWCILDLMTASGAHGRVFAVARPVKSLDVASMDSLCSVFKLTRAEKSVLVHIANGEAPKDIGRMLDMSIHTVRSHLRSICLRLGVKGINGALRLCLQMC